MPTLKLHSRVQVLPALGLELPIEEILFVIGLHGDRADLALRPGGTKVVTWPVARLKVIVVAGEV